MGPDLLELWKAQARAMHAYTAAVSRFNLANAEALAELCAPPGYAIDVLGDGKLKLQGECAKILKDPT